MFRSAPRIGFFSLQGKKFITKWSKTSLLSSFMSSRIFTNLQPAPLSWDVGGGGGGGCAPSPPFLRQWPYTRRHEYKCSLVCEDECNLVWPQWGWKNQLQCVWWNGDVGETQLAGSLKKLLTGRVYTFLHWTQVLQARCLNLSTWNSKDIWRSEAVGLTCKLPRYNYLQINFY